MLIAKIINDQVVEIADYRVLFPNVSFPSTGPDDLFLAENSCKQVTAFKSHDGTQKLQSCPPYIEGDWVFTVEVVSKSQEDLDAETASKATQVRSQRDKLLAETDWMVIKSTETGIPLDLAWATYRQALRDISDQPGFPNEVVFPEKP